MGYEIHQMDVKTAFLNGDIDHYILMEQPEGYVQKGKEDYVCKLKRSLYGLKQAPRIWYQLLITTLECEGFRRLDTENCILVRISASAIDIISVYVDDLIIITNNMQRMSKVKTALCAHFKMTDLGEIHFILGWNIQRNRRARTITIDQSKYAENMLKNFNMIDAHPSAIPMDPGIHLSKSMAPNTAQERALMADKPYRQLVGSFMYLVVSTRPDLAFFVHEVSKFVTNPGPTHWKALKHGLRYLK
jgi:hypothetical protein